MRLYMRPTRSEALTAERTTITRWSLESDAPQVLAQYSTAPLVLGVVAGTGDGDLFAMEHPQPADYPWESVCEIELRRWEDLGWVRTFPLPGSRVGLMEMACSPDGRWIIAADYAEAISLIDRETGHVSHRTVGSEGTTGLTFDATSAYAAAILTFQGGGYLKLWQIAPAEGYVPPPYDPDILEDIEAMDAAEQVHGPAVLKTLHGSEGILSELHDGLSRAGVASVGDLEGAFGSAVFRPDSRVVAYLFNSGWRDATYELTAYEVATGRRLWCVLGKAPYTGSFVFTPDGRRLILGGKDGDLLIRDAETGKSLPRFATGLSGPIDALAFAPNGERLWLASGQELRAIATSRLGS